MIGLCLFLVNAGTLVIAALATSVRKDIILTVVFSGFVAGGVGNGFFEPARLSLVSQRVDGNNQSKLQGLMFFINVASSAAGLPLWTALYVYSGALTCFSVMAAVTAIATAGLVVMSFVWRQKGPRVTSSAGTRVREHVNSDEKDWVVDVRSMSVNDL